MNPINKQYVAALELSGAGVIWGFGFVATIWTLQSFTALGVSWVRFLLSFSIGILVCLLIPNYRRFLNKQLFKSSCVAGILIGMAMWLQNWGLVYTTATKSGFITILYVVFVPLFEALFWKRKISRKILGCVILGLVGTAFIVELRFDQGNVGDLLTLGCAVLCAFHIIYIDRIQKHSFQPFVYNIGQSLWGGLVLLGFSVIFYILGITQSVSPMIATPDTKALWGLTSLTIGSTLLAFGLQVKAQRILSSTVASLLFLMEAPFALFFSVLILNDQISGLQIIGMILILSSAGFAVRFSRH